MGFKCGIVGLPNVGKSTLFNALTNSSKAQAENFPFCTIDPNIGVVPVPDQRLDELSQISSSKKKIIFCGLISFRFFGSLTIFSISSVIKSSKIKASLFPLKK